VAWSPVRGDRRAKVAVFALLIACLLTGYAAAVRFSEGSAFHASVLSAIALVFGGAWLALRGRPASIRVCIIAVGLLGFSNAGIVVLTGGAALGPLITMTVIPILATLLVSARLGGAVAIASCAALVLAAGVPAQIPSPGVSLGATDALVGVGLLTLSFWGGATYYERGRRVAHQQGMALCDELERTAARFRAYTENARDIVVEVADDGTILYASPGHEGFMGRTTSALLGGANTRNLHPEDLSHVAVFFKALVRGDRPGSVSARYVRPDGNLSWFELRGRHYRNAEGEGRVVLFARDETPERVAAEEREALIGRLQDALDGIETLRGIVPICSECKNVRREDGAWEQVEEYVAAHSLADFSHGLCDQCLSGHDL